VTTAIALARPDDLLRAGAFLGATADSLGTTVSSCRRSAAVPWVGRPNQAFQRDLLALATALVGARASFDAACDALLQYGRCLAASRDLAVEAQAIDRLLDPPPGLVDRALSLRAQAEQDEWAAANRGVAALRDLTDRVPRVGAGSVLSHDLSHFASGVGQAFTSLGHLLDTARRSLPSVGSDHQRATARDELGDTALEVLQPWTMLEDLWTALHDGHGFETGGTLAGGLLLHTRGKIGWDHHLFGGHDRLPAAVMLALQRGGTVVRTLDEYAVERLRALLVEDLRRLNKVPLPDLQQLLEDGVDLLHHEAHNGHTLMKHVGRDVDFLRYRQVVEPRTDARWNAMSSFASIDEAERVITQCFRDNASVLRHWLASGEAETKLSFPLNVPAGLAIDLDGLVAPAVALTVRLSKKADGTVLIRTAMLQP
jgi:hypothetical protein